MAPSALNTSLRSLWDKRRQNKPIQLQQQQQQQEIEEEAIMDTEREDTQHDDNDDADNPPLSSTGQAINSSNGTNGLTSTTAAPTTHLHLSVSVPSSSTAPIAVLTEKLLAENNGDAPTSPTTSTDSSTSSSAIDLSWLTIFFYSCGHVLNDLCAACWFTYLLIMLRARNLTDYQSGFILLAGQLADAVATPLCGIYSDKSTGLNLYLFRLERRQTWYLFGTIIVAINFFFVFGIDLPTQINGGSPTWALILYYCISASLFNVGWASVQVSHMAMVPDLSDHEHTRVVLNSARYSESVVANIAVFVILAIFTAVNFDEIHRYTCLAYVTLGLGLCTSLVFLLGVREKPAKVRRQRTLIIGSASTNGSFTTSPSQPDNSLTESNSVLYVNVPPTPASHLACCGRSLLIPIGGWKEWLYNFDFYKVGWVYMCTRLVVNVSQVFLAFYVLDTLQLEYMYTTVVPCVVYIFSFLAALIMKRANKRWGRKIITTIGTVFCAAALIILYFLDPSTAQFVYIPAVLLGIGNGTVMVCSTQLEADLIGRKTQHGAFVYGALSFTDKLANGVALFFLQMGNIDPVPDDDNTKNDNAHSDPQYIRLAICVLPFVASIAALVMLMWGIDIPRMIARANGDGYDDAEDFDGTGEDRGTVEVPYTAMEQEQQEQEQQPRRSSSDEHGYDDDVDDGSDHQHVADHDAHNHPSVIVNQAPPLPPPNTTEYVAGTGISRPFKRIDPTVT